MHISARLPIVAADWYDKYRVTLRGVDKVAISATRRR